MSRASSARSDAEGWILEGFANGRWERIFHRSQPWSDHQLIEYLGSHMKTGRWIVTDVGFGEVVVLLKRDDPMREREEHHQRRFRLLGGSQ
jgi:hypothetical protein